MKIALLALALALPACDRAPEPADPRALALAAAPRCPEPAPPIPCQPSGDGLCADLVGLCKGLELVGSTCSDLYAWCLGGESTCAMCNWLYAEALAQGADFDAGALLVECACLGVADGAHVCAR